MSSQSNAKRKTSRVERNVRLSAALAGIVLTVAAGYLALSRMGGELTYLSYDLPFLAYPDKTADEVRIVYLDELDGASLDRSNQAALLDKLGEAGARAVVYDLIFDLPSKDPEVDEAFAAAMLRFRGVDENWDPIKGAPRRHVFLACGRESYEQAGALIERLIPPNDQLIGAADDFGLVALVTGKNFTVRELITGTPDEPSLTWKAAAALGGELDEEDRLNPKRWLNYAGPPRRPGKIDQAPAIVSIGASEVMSGVPSLLRDKIVVVGAKPGIVGAELGLDLFNTPFHRLDSRGELPPMSGVEIQANGLINLGRLFVCLDAPPAFDDRGRALRGVVDCRRDYSHDTDQRLVSMERGRLPSSSGGPWMGIRIALLHRAFFQGQTWERATAIEGCL